MISIKEPAFTDNEAKGICLSLLIIFTGFLLITYPVSAALSMSPAYDISSNNATFNVTEITGNVAWVEYGQNPGGECWISSNYTPFAAQANITIWGAPILGNTIYIAKACDVTGCTAERSLITAQITPMPVPSNSQLFQNITRSHFNALTIWGTMFSAYTTIIPTTIFFGILLAIVVIGMWARNRSTRLVGILMMIISPIIVYTGSGGLNLGIPLEFQALGQALLAVGIAGTLLSFIKK